MNELRETAGCKPTNPGICRCTGAILTCICGVCQKCGRLRKDQRIDRK